MKAVILAGGKSTRLQSNVHVGPKPLRMLNGRPIIDYVLEGVSAIVEPRDVVIVVGYMGQALIDYLGDAYTYVWQREQYGAGYGTGYAARCAQQGLQGYQGPVYVGYGDSPLIRSQTIEQMAGEMGNGVSGVVLTNVVPEGMTIPPYGRILRNPDGSLCRIVEERNATPDELKVREVNVGPVVFDAALLWEACAHISDQNAQGEYLLTDVPGVLVEMGKTVALWPHAEVDELLGVNTPEDLAACEAVLRARG